MAKKTFTLPDPGEGLLEAEIVTWKVKEGDEVKVNDVVVEIETAKSLVELPIPWNGTIVQILVPEGQTADVGTPIVVVEDGTDEPGGDAVPAEPAAAAAQAQVADTESGDSAVTGVPAAGQGEGRVPVLVGYGAKAPATARRPRKKPAKELPSIPETGSPELWGGYASQAARTGFARENIVDPSGVRVEVAAPAPAPSTADTRVLAKPPVRKLAKDLGIDLAQVTGTGAGGVVTRADVEAHAAGRAPAQPSAPARGPQERETRIPVKGVRKMTAQAMVGSAFTAPHVTEFVTVDVTRTMELVDRLKADREFRDVRVSPLLVVAKAMCLAVRRNPGVNAVWDEAAQEIVEKHYVNLGIAAATPRGLVVPNVKDADAMTMKELAVALGELVETARAGRTQPADMSGGTITITNVGVFGVDTGTPIINPGESAILAFGAVRRQPWVVTGADGSESIEPRWVTQLALSFDHRLIDGELGSRFLADLAAILEDPAKGLVWG